MCAIFFRISEGLTASEVGRAINQLWNMYLDLKQGVIKNLAVNKNLLVDGNLSVLVAYGPSIFKISGIRKAAPIDLLENSFFESPRRWTNGSVSEHSPMSFSNELSENHAASDHFIIQLIADAEFFSTRALVQTLRELKNINSQFGRQILRISKWYTGFHSVDKRNWLGFHDGVSNLKSSERIRAVAIYDSKSLKRDDTWLLGGTYLAFLRISVDLDSWDKMSLDDQELIIGRDKLTGCPIIGVDRNGKPIKDPRCPVRGTFEIIQDGNEYFREHPSYGMQRNLPYDVKDYILKNSHIGRALDVYPSQLRKPESGRIFRQGFQFLESKNGSPDFTVGLNFISFQNNPKNLFNVINRKPDVMSANQKSIHPFERFLSVHSAGIFVVPPVASHEKFPGSSLFS